MICETVPRTTLSLIIAAIGLVAVMPGAAQATELENCAKLESDAERLACFDAAIKQQQEGKKAALPGNPSVAENPETPQKPPATEQPNERAAPSDAKPDLPREYTAVVKAMRKRPHGQMVVTLDNGEVWSEQYASRAFLVSVGDTVTMKKGRLSSSYRLVAPGGRGYKMTRLE